MNPENKTSVNFMDCPPERHKSILTASRITPSRSTPTATEANQPISLIDLNDLAGLFEPWRMIGLADWRG